MSKAYAVEKESGFKSITLTIELDSQEDVYNLCWLFNSSFDGLEAMEQERGSTSKNGPRSVHNTLGGFHKTLAKFAYKNYS
jgi:hypothetical protein